MPHFLHFLLSKPTFAPQQKERSKTVFSFTTTRLSAFLSSFLQLVRKGCLKLTAPRKNTFLSAPQFLNAPSAI